VKRIGKSNSGGTVTFSKCVLYIYLLSARAQHFRFACDVCGYEGKWQKLAIINRNVTCKCNWK
jgi:hypothetical protein